MSLKHVSFTLVLKFLKLTERLKNLVVQKWWIAKKNLCEMQEIGAFQKMVNCETVNYEAVNYEDPLYLHDSIKTIS